MKEENKIYAVIDTNVLVSSLFSAKGSSNPSKVIHCVFNGTIIPLYNFEIIEEYRDVLSRDKFHFKPNLINDLLSVFTEFGIDTVRKNITDEIFPDCDDIVFYEVAMSVEDAYLVTGNTKHFPRKAFVVTPAQMVEILRARGLLE
ncbi:MAG: putative toxin-antitoxin system toxin component, PIN family [Muribaculaceae bacterium]|nr:putative toxin-antitoxin system toxin component, PIN family [Muribaculaceae bacterium]